MPPVPVPDTLFIRSLEHVPRRGERRRWRDADRRYLYEWDSQHGNLEVYTRRGHHLGVLDADGRVIGEAIARRRINV
jgi:hypothetical protein